MECPFCRKEMQEGYIPADRSALTWHGGGREVRLTYTPILEEKAEAFYCPDCRQIILPVPELETFSQRVKKAVGKLTAGAEKRKSDWDEAQRKKEADRRKGKDPWER